MLARYLLCLAKNEVKLPIRTGLMQYYEPLVQSLPVIETGIREFVFAGSEQSAANIVLKNGRQWDYGNLGPFDELSLTGRLVNAPVRVLLGGSDLPYSEYQTIFTGLAGAPVRDDAGADMRVPVRSMLALLDKKIPSVTYTTTDYPSLEPNADGRVIPLLIGVCLNVKPTQVNTTNWTFRLGQSFKKLLRIRSGGVQVWQDGDSVGDPGDIVESITEASGEFKMQLWSGDTLTCDVEGEAAIGGALIETYGTVVRLLCMTAGIDPETALDGDAIDAMDTAAPEALGLVIDQPTKINDIMNLMDASVCATHGVTPAGLITARAWDADYDTVGAVSFDETDLRDLVVSVDDSRLYRTVRLGYAKNHTRQGETAHDALTDPSAVQEDWSHEYRWVDLGDDDVLLYYDNDEELVVDTCLIAAADADDVAGRYADLTGQPWLIVEFRSRLAPLELAIGDTIVIDHERLGDVSGQYYKVINLSMNQNNSSVTVRAYRLLSREAL
jgi:hypothetical protein